MNVARLGWPAWAASVERLERMAEAVLTVNSWQELLAPSSSSSYLFYAADREVSAEGQRIARRYFSSAEVDEEFVPEMGRKLPRRRGVPRLAGRALRRDGVGELGNPATGVSVPSTLSSVQARSIPP